MENKRVHTALIVSLAAISSWWWLYTSDCRSLSSSRISEENLRYFVGIGERVCLPVRRSFSRFSRTGREDVVINCS